MRLYNGPRKSKAYSRQTTPSVAVDTHYVFTDNLGAVTSGSYPGMIPNGTESFSSLYVPNFKKLVDEGWVIQNPYFKETSEWSFSTMSVEDHNYLGSPVQHYSYSYSNINNYARDPSLWAPVPSLFDDIYAASQECITRAFAKANSGSADLLIDLSQIRQTGSMFVALGRRLIGLASIAGALINLPSDLDNRNRTRRVRAFPVLKPRDISAVSGLWCEMRFGWRPLLSSLEGVADALSKSYLDEEKRITYRATENVRKEASSTRTIPVTNLGFTTSEVYTAVTTVNVNLRAGILVSETESLAKNLGLDIESIPIALWDLLPYSFIVDRFVNVGNYIRSLRPIDPTNFGGAWLVERYEHSHVYRGESLSIDASSGTGPSYKRWRRIGGANETRHTIKGTKRTIVPRPPSLPVLRWDWSSLNDIFNAVDGIMLAIQRLVPHNRRRN